MKYTSTNKPLQCTMTQSQWYKEMKNFASKPVGILWHDTGAGNPNVKRYVQPSSSDSNRDSLLSKIGINGNGNDWNRSSASAGVNAFIGKLADGSVQTVQVGPLTMPPWGCGNGSKGSCNGYTVKSGSIHWEGVHWIQFEICDDYYESKDYFNKVYKEAVEFTAYICKLYNINPTGTVKFNGVTVPTILCHKDSYNLGLGSGHSDVMLWFQRYGKTMKDVRNDVAKVIKESEVEVFKKGQKSLGCYAMKRLIDLGKMLGIYSRAVADDSGYGDGVDEDVKQAQKAAGLAQKSEADEATIRAMWKQVKAKITDKNNEITAANKTITAKNKEIQALNKKVDAALAKIDKLTASAGDVNGDGVVNTKDLLALRKKLAK